MSISTPISKAGISYYQHTLKTAFSCVGRGLHTGARATMRVLPADVNTGYVFMRRDVPADRNEVLPYWHKVSDTHLCTVVSNRHGVSVSTVEHLLAALQACGVDNAIIVLDGPEVPIMDGSARPFVRLIDNAGRQQQEGERKAIQVLEEVSVRDGERSARLMPAPLPAIDIQIDFSSTVIGKQHLDLSVTYENFRSEIACARTFGFVEQVNTLKALGFARGGTLQNAVLVDDDRIVNNDGLRFSDEFVRHKALDCIGDLAQAGGLVFGCYQAQRSGHGLNILMLKTMMSRPQSFAYRTIREIEADWLARHDEPLSDSA